MKEFLANEYGDSFGELILVLNSRDGVNCQLDKIYNHLGGEPQGMSPRDMLITLIEIGKPIPYR